MNTIIISTTTSLLQDIDSRNAFVRVRLDNIAKHLEFKNGSSVTSSNHG